VVGTASASLLRAVTAFGRCASAEAAWGVVGTVSASLLMLERHVMGS
jgi:hypothetical protein